MTGTTPLAPDVGALLAARARAHPATALTDDLRRYDYAELLARVGAVAGALRAGGIRRGDRVAVSLPNCTELVVTFLACVRLGAVWVGVSPRLMPTELGFALSHVGVTTLVAAPSVAARAREPVAAFVTGPTWVCDPDDPALGEWGEQSAHRRWPVPRPVEVDRTAPVAIAYTSGTTAAPKAVVHSQAGILAPALHRAASSVFGAAPSVGVCLPATSLNMIALGPLTTLAAGSACHLTARLDADGVTDLVERHRPATVSVPAPILADLLASEAIPEALWSDMAPLTTGGGSCPDALKANFTARFGVEVLRTYGLTEAPSVVCLEEPGAPLVPGASGRPLPYLTVRVRDEAGRRVPAGTVGEICVAPGTALGPGVRYTPMLGYWGDATATARALVDGELRTGDRGRLDPGGNLHVEGRGDAVVVRGGANIAVAEVEQVIAALPEVRRCAVVGVPDARLGARIVALVEAAGGDEGLPERVRARCAEVLSPHKVPTQVWRVDALPSAALEKVDRREAQAMAQRLAATPPAHPR